MRQIKFRGRTAAGYVYGDLVQWGGYSEPRICSWTNGCIYDVTEAAQLIARDIKGRDVYEGDLVERIADYDDPDFDRAKSFPMQATFDDFSAINNGEIILAEARYETDKI